MNAWSYAAHSSKKPSINVCLIYAQSKIHSFLQYAKSKFQLRYDESPGRYASGMAIRQKINTRRQGRIVYNRLTLVAIFKSVLSFM